MLKDPKVENKLLQTIAEFQGMVLRNGRFREVYAEGRDIVVLELQFSPKMNPAEIKTAVLALDKDITLNEQSEIVTKLLEDDE